MAHAHTHLKRSISICHYKNAQIKHFFRLLVGFPTAILQASLAYMILKSRRSIFLDTVGLYTVDCLVLVQENNA